MNNIGCIHAHGYAYTSTARGVQIAHIAIRIGTW
jgi:hypothetical protein